MIGKKLYDRLQKQADNLAEARKAAYELGFDEAYCCSHYQENYPAEMRKYISKLIGGGKWPQEVLDAYAKGIAQGEWES